MIRLLFMTDPHVRGTSPRARTDNYPEAISAKLIETAEIARQHKCDAVVCGGDFFDSPDPAPIVVREFARVLRAFTVPVYIAPGNHEIYGYNLDSIPRTMLGLLAEFDMMQILTKEESRIISDGKINIALTGQGFYHDIDRHPDDYMTRIVSTNEMIRKVWHVHVVHGMLVEKPLPYEVAHTLVKDCRTNADVVLSGHEHLGYGLIRRDDGVWFCNPGALGRVSAKVEEFHRQVRVAVFTFTEDGIFAELVPLKSARPGHEVLSRDHLIQAAEREERTAAFLALLAEDRETRLLDTREIINHIADSEQLPELVRVEALKRLGRAREQLSA
ncbi:MAG: metallophosphoesterase family protein [Candidatus Desulforudaceae bacterium]|nr:metallophosphoesterase [Clostridia bacterium]